MADELHNLFSFDVGNLFANDPPEDPPPEPSPTSRSRARARKTRDTQFFRRFKSETELENILDWDFEPGCAYHIISGGDIDSLSYLKFALRQQPLKYCIMSTWCMALQDIEEIERYLRLKQIGRMDCYVGEIFKGSYTNEWDQLCRVIRQYGGRVAMFRNHSKVYVGFGPKFDFVIESSANVNTNPRAENTVITVDSGLAQFYKDYFDDIVSFERNFDDWQMTELGVE